MGRNRFYPPKYHKGDIVGVFEVLSEFYTKEGKGNAKFYKIRCTKCDEESEREQANLYRAAKGCYEQCQLCSFIVPPAVKAEIRKEREEKIERMPELEMFSSETLKLAFSEAWVPNLIPEEEIIYG